MKAARAFHVRIGIDIDALRWERAAGITSYLQNTLEWMCRLEHGHQITLLQYGKPWMDRPEQLHRWQEAFPKAQVAYYFDGFSPPRLAPPWRRYLPPLARGLQVIDRRVLLPWWKRVLLTGPSFWSGWCGHLLSRKVDLLHHPSGVLLPLHRRANVLTVHDLIPVRLPELCDENGVEWFADCFAAYADQMDLVICYSEQTRRDVIDMLGVEEDRTRTIPLAAHERYRPIADRDLVQRVLGRHGLQGRPYILTLSTLAPHKNLSRLLKAFHHLREEEPALHHRLVVVGARGWKFDPIFETIRRLRLEDHVEWLGYVAAEELPALYGGAALFALPSLFEGFGLPALEAMACGTPVLTSRVSSLPEVVGDAGLLVDPYRTDEIADGMRGVLTDESLRQALRAKGLARSRLFSWEKTARMTLAAYEEARERSRRCPRPRRRAFETRYQRKRRRQMIENAAGGTKT